MHEPIMTTDPNTGEQIQLVRLAQRYQLPKGTVYSRYLAGKRGMQLVANQKRGSVSDAVRERLELEERNRYIELAKCSPLAKPFKHIGDAHKMAGDVQ
ncbi:MAG: hypothetical protein IKE45_01670 [Halomonas sp.]|nr:hypothetical protein [Halomonas sp.]MBR2512725.1 hypothetical protein [Halomonas sp.]